MNENGIYSFSSFRDVLKIHRLLTDGSNLRRTSHLWNGENKFDELSISCCNFKDVENEWEDI